MTASKKTHCPRCRLRSVRYNAASERQECETPRCGWHDKTPTLSKPTTVKTPESSIDNWWDEVPGA